MISVKKDFKDIPGSLGKRTDPHPKRDIKCKFEDDVRIKLSAVYHDKCAYCESKDHLEIEHYRPKGKVSKDNEHKGYYWLAYEWSNLLLACRGCNNGKDAKGTKFPLDVGGKRVYSPPNDRSQWVSDSETCLNEKPLLLNPEIDTPEDQLEFLYDGLVREIEGKKEGEGKERGKETIIICNLNRDSLRLNKRKKIIDETIRDLIYQSYQLHKRCDNIESIDMNDFRLAYRLIFNKIKLGMESKSEFSRLYFYFYNNFNDFLDENDEIKNKLVDLKKIIKEAFAMFKQGVL
jgi:uncharacterized protein (TIGR02646 family)